MKAWILLAALMLVSGAAAQDNETDNTTLPDDVEDEPQGFDMRLAISASAVLVLVVAFVYLAKR